MHIQDTSETPTRGRRRMAIDPVLWQALQDSATHRRTKVVSLTPAELEEVRRQLRSRSVKDEYQVHTTLTPEGPNHRLTFWAESKS